MDGRSDQSIKKENLISDPFLAAIDPSFAYCPSRRPAPVVWIFLSRKWKTHGRALLSPQGLFLHLHV